MNSLLWQYMVQKSKTHQVPRCDKSYIAINKLCTTLTGCGVTEMVGENVWVGVGGIGNVRYVWWLDRVRGSGYGGLDLTF